MRKKVSLKWQYWFNYLSVALLACTLVGLTLYAYSMNQLNCSVNEAVSVELATAANYLNEQTGILQDITVRVSNSTVFQRRNRDKDTVAQLEIVDTLKLFSNYSPLAGQCFLYYRDEPKIWKPGYMNSFSYYANLALGADDPDGMLDFLSYMEQMDVYQINAERLLLAMPLHIDVKRTETPDGVMGFVLERSTLRQQLSAYAPGLSEHLHLYFGATPLFDANPDYLELEFAADEQNIIRNGDLISSYSSKELFRLVIDINDSPMYDGVSSLSKINISIFLVAILALACLCYLLALRSWSPIRQLLDRHQDEETVINEFSVNELAEIDKLLTKSNLSEAMLHEQTQKLRHKQGLLTRQFFTHLLNGNLSGNLENRAEKLGIRLTGSLFQPLVFSFPAKDIPDDYLFSVEDLSDNGLSFFCVPVPAFGECVVILNADSEELLAEGNELLLALNDAYDSRIALQRPGEIRDSLSELSCALPYNEVQGTADKLREAIANADTDGAMELYTSLQVRCSGLPVTQQHFISTELILMLMNDQRFSSEENFSFATRLISENQQLPAYEAFREWVFLLCQHQHADAQADNGLPAQIMQYVDDHLDNCDLDINVIAMDLSVPSKAVRESIRSSTGLSTREYFNKRRVEKARHLLNETRMTVTEISLAVGYRSVSYFIKNFRMELGETPNAYRERHNHRRA